MYLSYIFYFKESTIITTEKQKAKQIQKKYRNVEGKSLPIVFDYVLPIRQSFLFFFRFSFFQLVLKLHPYLLAPFTIKGRKSPHSPYLFSYSFPSFGEEQKSLLFVFKQICFPPKVAANEQLQKNVSLDILDTDLYLGYVYRL